MTDESQVATPANVPSNTSNNAPVALFKKRNTKKGAVIRKRPNTPPPDSASASDRSDASDNDDTSKGKILKRRRKGGVDASVPATKHDGSYGITADTHIADTTATIHATDDATKQSNMELLGRAHVGGTDRPNRQIGPVKAPASIRQVTFYDLNPDVCKDYKMTGFCGFGDSCKFLHAREDYKAGWELDRDWEINTKGKKLEGQVVASANRNSKTAETTEEDMLKDIPFACFICKEPYKHPIVTKCGHYFCEKCALTRYRTTAACAACGAGTGGVFNAARDLQKLLDRKRARQAAEEQEDDDDE